MSRNSNRILPSELLHDLEDVQKEFFSSRGEIENLRAALKVEETKRMAAERRAEAESKESQRLRELRQEDLRLAEQQAGIYDLYESLSAKYIKERECWELRVKELEVDLGNKGTMVHEIELQYKDRIANLERELSGTCSSIVSAEDQLQSLLEELRQTKEAQKKAEHLLHTEYEAQIQDLHDRLKEKTLSISRLQATVAELKDNYCQAQRKLETHVQEASVNRNADVFKSRLLKLKKENDELRRQMKYMAER